MNLPFLRPPQRVLYITALGVQCYCVGRARGRNKVRLEAQFAQDEFAIARFYEYTATLPDAVYTLVADLVEEDFRLETIPVLRGSERSVLIERRIAQQYRDTPFSAAASLGKAESEPGAGVVTAASKAARAEERVQLMALTNAQPIQFWQRLLAANEHKIAGLYSPATLGGRVLDVLKPNHERESLGMPTLLATVGTAGLRQTLIERGVPRFARLSTEGDGNALGARAQAVVAEIGKTVQYLQSTRQVLRTAPLAVVLAVAASEAPVYRDAVRVSGLQTVLIEVADLVSIGGDAGGDAETLFVRAAVPRSLLSLGQQRLATSFAPADVTRYFDLATWRRRIVIGGACAGIAGAATGAWFLWEAWQANRAADGFARQAARLTDDYRRAAAGFTKSDVPLEAMRNAVTAAERLQSQTAAPSALLLDVSVALANTPEFQVSRLEWQLAETSAPLSSSGIGVETSRIASAAELAPNDAAGAAVPQNAPQAATAQPRYEVLFVEGQLTVATPARLTETLARAQRVVSQLSGAQGVARAQLTVLRWPVDTAGRGRIEGGVGAAQAEATQQASSGGRISLRFSRALPATPPVAISVPVGGAKP